MSGAYPSEPEIPSEEPRLTRGSWIGMVVVAAIVAGVVIFGLMARRGTERSLAKETAASAIPSVNVVYPAPSTLSSEIALPGNTQAFMDTPIYSRTNGYLKNWYFDIGAHVRKGQLMAQIETPEVDQQLQVAQADLKSAQANLDLANTTSARYQNLLEDQLRLEAGDRCCDERCRSQEGGCGCLNGECSPAGAVAVVRKGVRAL